RRLGRGLAPRGPPRAAPGAHRPLPGPWAPHPRPTRAARPRRDADPGRHLHPLLPRLARPSRRPPPPDPDRRRRLPGGPGPRGGAALRAALPAARPRRRPRRLPDGFGDLPPALAAVQEVSRRGGDRPKTRRVGPKFLESLQKGLRV